MAAPDTSSIWSLVGDWIANGFGSIQLPDRSGLLIPFLKGVSIPIGIWGFIILSYFVIVGTSNAVNLTDGLDGLAILPSALVALLWVSLHMWLAVWTTPTICCSRMSREPVKLLWSEPL